MSVVRPDSSLAAAEVPTLIASLRDAQRAIGSLDDRIERLGRVADLWLGDAPRLRDAAQAVGAQTGYAEAMIVRFLEQTFCRWRAPHLRDLLEGALFRPGSRAIAPELVVAILAQNTPGLAIAPVFTSLGLGSAILVKPSHGETSFAALLCESIREVSPELGRAYQVRTWKGGDASIEAELFAEASRIVAYGSAATVASVRARAGERVIACGPRVSVAVVGNLDAAGMARVAPRLARDVAFLDQRGCLSPQAVLVDERADRGALGRALASELAALEKEWPRRRLSLDDGSLFRRAVDAAELRVIRGEAAELHGGGGEPWAVVVENQTTIASSPLDRFVGIHPFSGPDGLSRTLRSLAGLLECVGIDGSAEECAQLGEVSRRAGAGRVCAIGEMQDPPAGWHSGARPPVSDYLSWSNASSESQPSLRERFDRFVAQTSDSPRGIEVVRARGTCVYDSDGKRYLDLLSGIGVASIGHTHPAVARAVAEQATRYTHVMVYGEDVLAPQVAVAERLASLLPPSLGVTYLTNSGAEAIEGALKLARKATGRSRVLAFEGAFHGDTTGALALGGNPYYREPFRPLLDVEHLPWNDERALDRIDSSAAAVFAEPIQAEGGVRIPSPGFLAALAKRCRDVGALFILDEVVTGLGRTGGWFAFEHWPGAEPDVLVLAKSLGGGLPLGAFISSKERMAVLAHDPPLGHVTTFGGNPVCCAAALASLDVLASGDLPARARDIGAKLLSDLSGLIGTGGLVAVRGLGLLIGLELADADQTKRFADACRKRGVLLGWTLHHDRVVRLAPPLTITKSELDEALEGIASALSDRA